VALDKYSSNVEAQGGQQGGGRTGAIKKPDIKKQGGNVWGGEDFKETGEISGDGRETKSKRKKMNVRLKPVSKT